MQTSAIGTTVRIGNHTLSPQELAAGVPERLPFVDETGTPVDPDTVSLRLQLAETDVIRTYRYPTPEPEDDGTLQHEETGRFYVDYTPLGEEDGRWDWYLLAAMEGGSSLADQDVFYVQRPLVPVS